MVTSEQYELFQRYLNSRHGDGGMVDMSMADFKDMVEESHVDTNLIEYRIRDADSGITGKSRGKLVAVALTDSLQGAVSMVYSFFDPDMEERSLGTYLILDHINRAIAEGLFHVYLGYWVKGSPKMEYKTRFRPMEFLGPNGWQDLL